MLAPASATEPQSNSSSERLLRFDNTPQLSPCVSQAKSFVRNEFVRSLLKRNFITGSELPASYELRHYNETKWASTAMEGASRDSVNSQMFFTLFNIDGHNADDVKIPMTAPVVTTMAHGQGPNCASNFTMHFMIPQAQWSKPIEPTDPKVHIVTLPAMDVYVRSFSGFPKDGEYTQQAADLYQSLPKSSNVTVDTQAFYSAGYDGPYQFSHRHNEVWIRRL